MIATPKASTIGMLDFLEELIMTTEVEFLVQFHEVLAYPAVVVGSCSLQFVVVIISVVVTEPAGWVGDTVATMRG